MTKPKPSPTPETKPASEAIVALTDITAQRCNALIADLSAMALRDAGLDPKDGWRYDPNARVFVKVPNG